jgi:hypothetical protein
MSNELFIALISILEKEIGYINQLHVKKTEKSIITAYKVSYGNEEDFIVP